ncbi:MAG: 3-octaprenyl-4-hydroxybenzoate carboxy-lyase [Desulfuromonas sp.]|nr:MAG: 3-octaprenyl-4-hydroxybenzoate carboxy-lyase [Desulfuromonas sp.]
MGYRNLSDTVLDLEHHGKLRRIDLELDPHLEIGMIQRRVFAAGGPALLFTNPRGSRFPLLGNLYGTMERARFLFRDTLPVIEQLVNLKCDPMAALKTPLQLPRVPWHALNLFPRKLRRGPILSHTLDLDQLPQLVSWPNDGGAFVTLPQVYSEDPQRPGFGGSNLGMYRVQISGNDYTPNREVGLHYQIHRGIGVHDQKARDLGKPLRVNIVIGGPPSLAVAAVMPLPEGMSELGFAGLLGGHRLGMVCGASGLPIPAEADFCITGTIDPERTRPEGPFGDHLGYYSLTHDFPMVKVEQVYHRPGAIWPFTTVGRPPQEDTIFGTLIHEMTGPLIPTVLPGVAGVHAVDDAGVHPLLLAIGSERYTPYSETTRPQELLTQANAILGQGQLSLAKYLFIAAQNDAPQLSLHDMEGFFTHLLARVDWRRDIHFQTRTTIDTLDYSGSGLNQGSKVIIAAAGPAQRPLPTEIPSDLQLPDGFSNPRLALPGVLVLNAPSAHRERGAADPVIEQFCADFSPESTINLFPLVIVVDDSDFTARTLSNLLWVTFTRSNPASDIYGIGAETVNRHWGCRGSLIIDARSKPHHAPPLEEDPALIRKVEELAAPGGALRGLY